MYRAVLLLLCAGTCFAAQPSEEAVKKELKLFQGKWACTGGQNPDGKPFDKEMIKDVRMVIDGNKFSIMEKDNVTIEGTFTVDPSKKIKTIDVELTKPITGKMLGIYQVDGDTRKSCFAETGKGRPAEFGKDAGYILFEWKRVK